MDLHSLRVFPTSILLHNGISHMTSIWSWVTPKKHGVPEISAEKKQKKKKARHLEKLKHPTPFVNEKFHLVTNTSILLGYVHWAGEG